MISGYTKIKDPHIFDKILERLDISLSEIKQRWAYEHHTSEQPFLLSGREKIYHMKNWQYFIDLSCYNPELMKEFLFDSAIDDIKDEKLFRDGVNAYFFQIRCARTIEGLESILLKMMSNSLVIYELDSLLFDKILERIDILLSEIKEKWAENHVYLYGEVV